LDTGQILQFLYTQHSHSLWDWALKLTGLYPCATQLGAESVIWCTGWCPRETENKTICFSWNCYSVA